VCTGTYFIQIYIISVTKKILLKNYLYDKNYVKKNLFIIYLLSVVIITVELCKIKAHIEEWI